MFRFVVVVVPFPALFCDATVGPFDVFALKKSVGDTVIDSDVGALWSVLVVGTFVGGRVAGACVLTGFCVGAFVATGFLVGAVVETSFLVPCEFIGCAVGDPAAVTIRIEKPVGDVLGATGDGDDE